MWFCFLIHKFKISAKLYTFCKGGLRLNSYCEASLTYLHAKIDAESLNYPVKQLFVTESNCKNFKFYSFNSLPHNILSFWSVLVLENNFFSTVIGVVAIVALTKNGLEIVWRQTVELTVPGRI